MRPGRRRGLFCSLPGRDVGPRADDLVGLAVAALLVERDAWHLGPADVRAYLDTVPDAGRYDGVLGVLLGVAAVRALAMSGRRLPFAVEVIGFSEEEGIRFRASYLGSRAFTGRFDAGLLERTDADGITLPQAMEHAGYDPGTIGPDPERLSGIEGEVEIRRDRWGVPHVRAQTRADAWFAEGFCHGQDRLWQLELYRRAASGTRPSRRSPKRARTGG